MGPTPPAPLTADDGGGGAELDEGGRDLERDETPVRVCVVLCGRRRNGTMMVVGSWWKREERRGRFVAHRTVHRYEARVEWVVVDKCRVGYLAGSLHLLHC